MDRPSFIQTRNIRKNLGEREVLRGVDIDIRKGETRVIIGQSGCGKSVFLKHLIGLFQPDAGTVMIDGLDTTNLKAARQRELMHKFGMLFQGAALFDSLTIRENIAFKHIRNGRMSQGEIDRLVAEKLDLVGLAGIEDQKPAELSGGMQKRVGLARAIADDPEIILYDEPTTGLDPITADQINDLIIHLQKVLNVTSVAVTHDMVSAKKIGTNISMLYNGRIIETVPAARIGRSKNPVVQQFINGRAQGPITDKGSIR